MRQTKLPIVLVLLIASGIICSKARQLQSPSVPAATSIATDRARLSENYAKLPMRFETNQGQSDGSVKFVSRGHGYGLYLTSTEAMLVLSKTQERQDVLRMQ